MAFQIRPPLLFLAFIGLLGLHTLAILTMTSTTPSASEQAKHPNRTVSVTATGSVSMKPDIALITAGVVTEDKRADGALKKNSAAMTYVFDELKKSGIKPEDFQTTDFSVQPKMRYIKNAPPEIQGYTVNNSIRIRVRDLTKLGEMLDKVVSLGSNQIGNIDFQVTDADKLKDKARERAMENAMRKARLYAIAAGANLGSVLTIREQEQHGHHPRMAMSRMEKSADSVPIASGEKSLTVQLHVTWTLN